MSNRLQDVSRLYLDTNILIYFLEGNRNFGQLVEQVFEFCEEFEIAVFTSEITVTECLIGPCKGKNFELVHKYEAFFKASGGAISIVPVESTILWDAPKIAAQYGLKLVDALHVTTAYACGCDGFLTNDRGIGPLADGLGAHYLNDGA